MICIAPRSTDSAYTRGLQRCRKIGLVSGSAALGSRLCAVRPVQLPVRPVQLPVRKVPIAIKEKGKEELKRLTSLGVIEPVEGPIEWVSSLVVVEKNG